MPQLLYFAHLLSPSYIRSQNAVCQYGEDVLTSSILIGSLTSRCVPSQPSGALRPNNINWLPVLSNIEPQQIRCDRATEYKKAHQLTDRVPIKEILREPPMSRLKSRRLLVIEAARLANLNKTEQETWVQSWSQGVPPGHDLVTNPTCPQPGFTLPRRQMWPGQMLRLSPPMWRDRITCLPLRREPPDHDAHC